MNDGLADASLIRSWDIKTSSNQEHVNSIRPGGKGWKPDLSDTKRMVTIFVGDALRYGATIRLPRAKYVEKFDVILSDGQNTKHLRNNKPDAIIKIPFGTTVSSVKLQFHSVKPECQIAVTVSILGCFESHSTTEAVTTATESWCVMNDGLADASLIRSWDIKTSSNQEHVNSIRPGGKGWKPDLSDTKRTVTIFVGDALRYGATIRLSHAKYVEKFDVILSDGQNTKRLQNNSPDAIIKIPFGTTVNSVKLQFHSVKPECQIAVTVSILGCFESQSTTEAATTATESWCVMNDGLADASLIRSWDIKTSSNQEHVNSIRPGGKGWKPDASDTKRTVTIFVGDALRYGATMRLPHAKYVEKFDVILSDGQNTKNIRNNNPDAIIKIPFGTTVNSIKLQFYSVKPECQIVVTVSILGCFESQSTTIAATTTTGSWCVMNDGLADASLIRSWDIKTSSNQEHVNSIRPGGKGWKPDVSDKNPTVTIFVGDALRYGATLRLPHAKYVEKFDVILSDGQNSMHMSNNKPDAIIKIPFGTTVNSVKLRFHSVKPECQIAVTVSILGCFESQSTTEAAAIATESWCVMNDGLADASLIRSWDIKTSSNQEHVNSIRPGGKGWKPDLSDTKRTVTIFVGDALRYGATIRLPHAKYVEKFDVILSDEQNTKPLHNNKPDAIIKIPFGTTVNSIKLRFYSVKPDCQLVVTVSILGCFELQPCKIVDGMSSSEYIPSSSIKVSSNPRYVNALRPFRDGWKSDERDHKRTITINVGNAFVKGGHIKLKKSKFVANFDVIFDGNHSIKGNKPGQTITIPRGTKYEKVTLKFYPTENCSVIVAISIKACFKEKSKGQYIEEPVTGRAPDVIPNELVSTGEAEKQVEPAPLSRSVCTFDKCTFMREFGFDGPHIVGWIEKDGIEGITNETEVVYMEEKLEEGVVINVACTQCLCKNGNITCDHKICEGCMYSGWQGWSSCSKTCDNGFKIRTRGKHVGKGNEPCNLPLSEIQDCNIKICHAETVWSSWSSWSPCIISKQDAVGSSIRKRTCHRGIDDECAGEVLQTMPCQSKVKTTKTCTGGSVWSECSNRCPITCLDARREVCVESDECIPGCHCPAGQVQLLGQCVPIDKCPCYNIEGISVLKNLKASKTHPCRECTCSNSGKIVCQEKSNCCLWSPWTSWGGCSTSCGIGKRFRYKTLLGGSSSTCKSYEDESDACELKKCPPDCQIDGKFYYYNEKIREDDCQVCYCRESAEKCEPLPFSNATAGWSDWTEWSGCTQTCQGGINYRLRYCNNPLPRCGAAPCKGLPLEQKSCNEKIACFAPSNTTDTKGECQGELEVYTTEESCERTCENRFETNIFASCKKKSHCICKDGYYRNQNECVPGTKCDVCHINGTVYEHGSIWESSAGCEICQCVGGKAVCKRICPIPECNEDEKLIYEKDNCCPKCKHITEGTCGLHKVWDYLKNSNDTCQSVDKIQLTYCSGGCGDTRSYPMLTNDSTGTSSNHCHCCEGSIAKVNEVIVQCKGEEQKRTMFYPEFWCCKCTECKK
uniref:Uncharacterized protein n=1 Tax=Octopus bimaculoides TaxID=37653 RepID=A0A0L8GSU4_OCTBM